MIERAVEAREEAREQLQTLGAAILTAEILLARSRSERNRAIIAVHKHGLLTIRDMARLPGFPKETYIRQLIAKEER